MSSRAENPVNFYPHKFHKDTSVPEFLEKFAGVPEKEVLSEVKVRVAGRIMSSRNAGKNLKFYDLHADGCKVQIHANAK